MKLLLVVWLGVAIAAPTRAFADPPHRGLLSCGWVMGLFRVIPPLVKSVPYFLGRKNVRIRGLPNSRHTVSNNIASKDFQVIYPSNEDEVQRYVSKVVPETIAVGYVDGWQVGDAPFHAYLRIGDVLFHLDQKGAHESTYSVTLQAQLNQQRPITNFEILLPAPRRAFLSLLSFFRDRVASRAKISGNVVQNSYDVGGFGHRQNDTPLQENCVAFALSFLQPYWLANHPELANFPFPKGLDKPQDDNGHAFNPETVATFIMKGDVTQLTAIANEHVTEKTPQELLRRFSELTRIVRKPRRGSKHSGSSPPTHSDPALILSSISLQPPEVQERRPPVRLFSGTNAAPDYGAIVLAKLSDGSHVVGVANGSTLGHESILELIKRQHPHGVTVVFRGEVEFTGARGSESPKILRVNERSGSFARESLQTPRMSNSYAELKSILEENFRQMVQGTTWIAYDGNHEQEPLSPNLISRHEIGNLLHSLTNLEHFQAESLGRISEKLPSFLQGLQHGGIISASEAQKFQSDFTRLMSVTATDEKTSLKTQLSNQAAKWDVAMKRQLELSNDHIEIHHIPVSPPQPAPAAASVAP